MLPEGPVAEGVVAFTGSTFLMFHRWALSLSRSVQVASRTCIGCQRRVLVTASSASHIRPASAVRKVGKLKTRDEYLAAYAEVCELDNLYYDGKNTGVEDWEYDALRRRVEEVEKERPEWVGKDGPLSAKVGVRPSGFRQVRHRTAMLSLANTYSREELERFVERIVKKIGESVEYVAELKVDGVALELVYEDGEMAMAVTRGDGTVGDDVTDNIRVALLHKGIPQILPGSYEGRVEVRGEVYMSKRDFEVLNQRKGGSLSNARNTVAGLLKHKMPEESGGKRIRFVAYDCAVPPYMEDNIGTHLEKLRVLENWGFEAMPRYALCRTVDEILAFADNIEQEREGLHLETDGVVVKVNSSIAYNSLGATAKAPRGAVAYKFAGSYGITEVEELVLQVSRFGTINPVARVVPVKIGGVTINRATLHNFDEIERLGVAVGDMVALERAGDVIPKIIRIQEESKEPSRKVIQTPKRCPSCGSTILVEKDDDSTTVRCPNSGSCKAQIRGRIVHFASRKAMDIRGLGVKTVEKLVASKLIRRPSDLFQVERDDLVERVEGFKDKSASNLVSSIKDAGRNRNLQRLINGLGIPGVGETIASALASHARSIQGLRSISPGSRDALLAIPNFAEKSADTIISFLSKQETQHELEALESSLHLKPENEIKDLSAGQNTDIRGKSFAFTGSLQTLTRGEARASLLRAGAAMRQTVSKNTDYLVVGRQHGSTNSSTNKLTQAKRWGVKKLTEQQFKALLGEDEVKGVDQG